MLQFKTTIGLALFFALSACISTVGLAQDANLNYQIPRISDDANKWVDNTYNSLSIDDKIAQLFMVAAYSGTEKYNEELIISLIEKYHIGGLIFMQGTAAKQAALTNQYQKASSIPLFIAMDAEWGLGMRLQGIKDLPRQMYMGATRNKELMHRYGAYVAGQCLRMGVHINFAPVIDVNNNPQNPVINFRSFGEDKKLVSELGIEYMRALQENNVMACAKHFPGHGDTDADSHKELPQINKSKIQLEQTELYPFDQLIRSGIQSIMVAHLNIPSLEPSPNLPTTLSDKIVTQLLKKDLGFQGLVFTDALNMQGVTKSYQPGEVDYLAFKAGNDVLLFSENVPKGIERIKAALTKGDISESRLEESVKKILLAKYQAGLMQLEPIDSLNIDKDLNELTSVLRKAVAEKGITLLNDPYNTLDRIKKKDDNRIAYIFVGTSSHPSFETQLKKAGITDIFYANTNTEKALRTLHRKMDKFDAVIVGVHNMSGYPTNNYGLDKGEIQAIRKLSDHKNGMTVLYGNPYALSNFEDNVGYMVCYDETEETLETSLRILTGQISPLGTLPVSISAKFKAGSGIKSATNDLGEQVIIFDKDSEFAKRWRAKNSSVNLPTDAASPKVTCCVNPDAIGSNSSYLDRVDQLMESAMKQGAFPGCRILAAKGGKVFYDKSFGYLEDDHKTLVTANTLYDLASVTKIAATTLAVMKLYDQGKLNLDATLGQYLSWTKNTNKESVQIKNLLLHQAGLEAWIPFYKETLDDYGYPKSSVYQNRPNNQFNVQVMSGLYMNKQWIDTMWKRILDSDLSNLGRYKYSDLDFIFLQKVVEKISGLPLDEFVKRNFYQPLGMVNTCFNPIQNNLKLPIAPSEFDGYFRHRKVQGYVHDMGAAMFGGVSGHAGLFSTAEDMGILMQMLLNGGTYDSKRYLKESTVELFTSKNSFISRRALGFDKPEPNGGKSQPTSSNCSLKTFGHTGFTGTCVWADPKNNILFIFLSNRTYPSSTNWKINSLDVREKAQEYIYRSFGITNR